MNIGTDADTVGSGSLTATDAVVAAPAGDGTFRTGASTANSTVFLLCPGGDSAWNIQLTGTFGGGTVWFEESVDSTTGADGNWIAVNGRQTGVVNTVLASGVTTAGHYRGNTSGVKYLRVRITGATTPNVAATLRLSSGTGAIFLNASTPAGTNTIGAVTAPGAAALALDATLTGGTQKTSLTASTLIVSTTAAAAAAVTCTLPAAGAGLFHYITRVNILKYASVAVVGGAAPVVVTSTNLPGPVAWTTPTGQAVGTQYETDLQPAGPIKSSVANTATTIVCPATASIIWRVNVFYYTGP